MEKLKKKSSFLFFVGEGKKKIAHIGRKMEKRRKGRNGKKFFLFLLFLLTNEKKSEVYGKTA